MCSLVFCEHIPGTIIPQDSNPTPVSRFILARWVLPAGMKRARQPISLPRVWRSQFWKQIAGLLNDATHPPQYSLSNFLSEAAIGLREDGASPQRAGLVAMQVMLRHPTAVGIKLAGVALNALLLMAGRTVKRLALRA